MVALYANVPNEISQALTCESVSRLFKSVSSRCQVDFVPSRTSLWGSSTTQEQTTIEYAPCKHAAEALAHELLHAEIKLRGYRQYGFLVVKEPSRQKELLRELLRIIDNELQHHKFASRFEEMGLELVRFYNDGDVNVFKKVRRTLQGMSKENSLAEFFSLFVAVIAPGGAAREVERTQLRNFLQARCNQSTWTGLIRIEELFERWRDSSSLNAEPFVKEILEVIRIPETYWVGASADFPKDGFLVGNHFGRTDAGSRA